MIVRQTVGFLSLDDARRNERFGVETKRKKHPNVRSVTRARSGTLRSNIRVKVTLDPTPPRRRVLAAD
jgi:hypothetical protein